MAIQLPQYSASPYYTKSQEELSGLGTDLLKGDIPSYYAPIGQMGGALFEDVLRGTTADITRGVTEDVARRGGRGGLAADVIGRQVGRTSKDLRYNDMIRAIEGRKGLLNLGAGITSGVRGAGLTEAGHKGQFGLSAAGLDINQEQFAEEMGWSKEKFGEEMKFREKELTAQMQQWQYEKDAAEAKAKGDMWGSIIKGVGTIGGMALGGPLGASLGGMLGSSLGKTGSFASQASKGLASTNPLYGYSGYLK